MDHINTSDKQSNNSRPWLWKKGQSGNPAGRPKGKTMKEFARDYLARMTDEEREAFFEGMPKDVIWKMAEGNPTHGVDFSATREGLDELTAFMKDLANPKRS